MILTRVRLSNFRSHVRAQLDVGPWVTVLTGPNGSGKTTFLEAVACVAGLRLRPLASEAELVRWGQEGFTVVVEAMDAQGVPHRYTAARQGASQVYRVDGRPYRPGQVGTPAAVAFTPDDLELVKGPPVYRRTFLERDVRHLSPGYGEAWDRYRRALRQRNAALAAGAPPRALAPWDEAVCTLGAQVCRERQLLVAALAPRVREAYRDIAGGGELALMYVPALAPGVAPPQEEDVRAWTMALTRSLAATRGEERQRGHTLVGPHRDDLTFLLDGADMRRFASQGEKRTAALALRLALADQLQQVRHEPPWLLLDDVFSELDDTRQQALWRALPGRQVLATAAHVPPFLSYPQVRQVHMVPVGEGTMP